MLRALRNLTAVGIGVAVVGIALLILSVARTLAGNSLGTWGVVLLWVGVGLVVVAVALLTATLFGAVDAAVAPATQEPPAAEPTA